MRLPWTRPSGPSQPYYPKILFYPLCPVALVYSAVATLLLRLTGKLTSPTLVVPVPASTRGRVALVTGSNTGIGFEAAKSLAQNGWKVILACRSRDKAEQACQTIGINAVFEHPLDLSSLQSVRDFCAIIKSKYNRIDVIINNAGRNTDGESEKGLDLLFQSNFLGHYLLTAELMELLIHSHARIVTVSSVMHHFCYGHHLESVTYWKDCATAHKEPLDTYALSKLAANLFAIELNQRYQGRIRAIAVNPGTVNSDIWREYPTFMRLLFRMIYLNPQQGCHTLVVAASHDLPEDVTYLQPYWMPMEGAPMLPFTEQLGPFVGSASATARLPPDGGRAAASALWIACQEPTQAEWPTVA